MLIGQAPGQVEAEGGRPFAGRAGRTLFQWLSTAGMDELIPVGRLAIERFLGAHPLVELVGREHEVSHEGGTSIAIPLPHPSGASSWIHAPGNRALPDRALALLRRRLGREPARSVA